MTPDGTNSVDKGGRPASTSAHDLAAHAQRLFVENGFDETSIEDIAAAAGVSRRTFFRYFPNKADVVWVESDFELAHLQKVLDEATAQMPLWGVITEAFTTALDHGRREDEWARHRAQLILQTPAVQVQANAVYRRWREQAAAFVGSRTGLSQADGYPIAVGHAAVAASVAAHEYWLAHPELLLGQCMRTMFALMAPHPPPDADGRAASRISTTGH